MNPNCKQCQKSFHISEEDQSYYTKQQVPPPTFCPDCRLQRRLTWRNERSLYQRKCDLTGKNIVSIYASDSPCKRVYANDVWWAEEWDPLEYGRDYDFNRPFFEQWNELNLEVPKLALINDNGTGSENCEYTSDYAFGKNCYFIFCAWRSENSYYSFYANNTKNVCDTTFCNENEWLYECVDCTKCSQCVFLINSSNSNNCHFSFDLKNCSNCLFCTGLRGKEYCIENKQYTKDGYFAYLKEHTAFSSYKWVEEAKEKLKIIMLHAPRKHMTILNSDECVGDYIVNSKNCMGFNLINGIDTKYAFYFDGAKQSMDINNCGEPEFCLESITSDNTYGGRFTIFSWKNTNITYTNDCHSSKNLFGCVSLKRKEYCILNKQYTKEEYEELAPRIIEHMKSTGEWGEFFPSKYSPFGYNETTAQEFFPNTEEEIKNKGWHWKPKDMKNFAPANYELQDSSQEEGEEVLKAVLACTSCTKNYRLIPQEYAFYKYMHVPVPRQCPDCRHAARWTRRNPMKSFTLFDRTCDECHMSLKSTYAPERPEKILCEPCYEKAIY